MERRIPFWPFGKTKPNQVNISSGPVGIPRISGDVLNPGSEGPAWSHNNGFQNISTFQNGHYSGQNDPKTNISLDLSLLKISLHSFSKIHNSGHLKEEQYIAMYWCSHLRWVICLQYLYWCGNCDVYSYLYCNDNVCLSPFCTFWYLISEFWYHPLKLYSVQCTLNCPGQYHKFRGSALNGMPLSNRFLPL